MTTITSKISEFSGDINREISSWQDKLYPGSTVAYHNPTPTNPGYHKFAKNHGLVTRIALIPTVAIDATLEVLKKVVSVVDGLARMLVNFLGALFSENCSIAKGIDALAASGRSVVNIPFVAIKGAWQMVHVLLNKPSTAKRLELLE